MPGVFSPSLLYSIPNIFMPTKPTYMDRNLLLKELGYHSYHDYLDGQLWQKIRAKAFQVHGRVCLLCDGVATVIHHHGYGRAVLLGESLLQLIPLCQGCHERVEYRPNGTKRSLHDTQLYFRVLLRGYQKKVEALPPDQRRRYRGFCQRCGKKARQGKQCCQMCLKRK